MDIANWGLGQFVYRASLLLLYPTLVLLGLSFLRVMWHLGELAYDTWIARCRPTSKHAGQLREIVLDEHGSPAPSLRAIAANRFQHPQLRRFARLLVEELNRGMPNTLPARIDHLVSRAEAALARDVNRVRVLVRLGPCLGLAGTLIPLGPGLMALSEGDLSRLSAQLVVAFSTTVVGLLVGGISYVIALTRAHWADLVASDLELVSDLVCTLLDRDRRWQHAGRVTRTEAEELSP